MENFTYSEIKKLILEKLISNYWSEIDVKSSFSVSNSDYLSAVDSLVVDNAVIKTWRKSDFWNEFLKAWPKSKDIYENLEKKLASKSDKGSNTFFWKISNLFTSENPIIVKIRQWLALLIIPIIAWWWIAQKEFIASLFNVDLSIYETHKEINNERESTAFDDSDVIDEDFINWIEDQLNEINSLKDFNLIKNDVKNALEYWEIWENTNNKVLYILNDFKENKILENKKNRENILNKKDLRINNDRIKNWRTLRRR